MNRVYSLHIISLLFLFFTACNLDPLSEQQESNFDKLYAFSENVEAIDFICKPDASGYILVGNTKSDENSDVIIINVSSDGMQENLHRIYTPFYDEAVSIKIKEDDNSIFILVHRSNDASEDNIQQNLLIQTNLDGIPIKDNNTTDTVSADFKILTLNETPPIELTDFTIENQVLIAIGNMIQEGTNNRRKVSKIYNFNSVNFNSRNDSIFEMVREKAGSSLNESNSNLKIFDGNDTNSIYEVFGQNFSENPNTESNAQSLNISWEIFTDIESSASEILYIGTDKNEVFGDILYHSNGKNYIAGNYLETDTIFLVTKDYDGSNNNKGQDILTIAGYGNRVSSLTEDENGSIIMSTIEEGGVSTSSHLLKFSQSASLVDGQDFEFLSTGFYNIQKIESEPGNILVVMSQKTFDNNSTAIGLMKIKF